MPQIMQIILQILFFFIFTTTFTAVSSSPAPPPLHPSHLLKRLPRNATSSPQEYYEITKPLPTDGSPPSCTLPIFSHDFGNTINLPISANYSRPTDCKWTRVTLEIRISSQGERYDRVAAVWLGGAELIRTSSAEPTANGAFWTVHKDITRYAHLLAKQEITLSVMLENIVNELYTGVYQVNVTFYYYDTTAVDPVLTLPSDKVSSDLYEKPADFIIPVSNAAADDGYWFRIEKGSQTRSVGIQIPPNTYKAVLEIYVSFHGDDEFWYSNPPDSYIEMNKLPTDRGHGAYREVLLTIDGKLAGTVVPFPVIFAGGINPLFWAPIVSIGAFNLPSYDIDLTPFLGFLLDGKLHYFELGVAESISFWLINANLHLWLDYSAIEVQAGSNYIAPHFSTDREFEFEGLDGDFEIEVKRKSEISGWVNSTAGNFTTTITSESKFKNEVKFKNDAKHKSVEQKVKEKIEIKVLSSSGKKITHRNIDKEYPLKITSEAVAGAAPNTYLINTELENSIEDKNEVDGDTESKLENSQKCKGWMFVQDDEIVSGAAKTNQHYQFKEGKDCYSRKVEAYNGEIMDDHNDLLCESLL